MKGWIEMMSDRMNTQQGLRPLIMLTAMLITLIAPAGSALAQSTDPDNAIPMTTDTVRGRFPAGKEATHYYTFVGGPGEIKVFFDFVGQPSSAANCLMPTVSQ
jgi:hypothetical protein